MALQPCRECGTEVSTSAESCPKCGAPIAGTKSTEGPFLQTMNAGCAGCLVIIVIIALISMFGGMAAT